MGIFRFQLRSICLGAFVAFAVIYQATAQQKNLVNEYGKVIVKEAKITQLVNELERWYFYLNSYELLANTGVKIQEWKDILENTAESLQIRKNGDWLTIDYDKVNRTLNEIKSEAEQQISLLKNETTKKFSWWKEETAKLRRENEAPNQVIPFILRIDDFYQRVPELVEGNSYYKGNGNWESFKPLNFDAISPHPWLFGAMGDVPAGTEPGEILATPYDLPRMRSVIERNLNEGYLTNVDIHIPGSIGTSLSDQWDRTRWQNWAKRAQSVVQYAQNIPGVRGFELVNEPELTFVEEVIPFIEKELQDFLRGKYTAIAPLNEKWQSNYDSFEDIALPQYSIARQRQRLVFQNAHPGLMYELNLMQSQFYIEYFEYLFKTIKKQNSSLPVSSQFTFNPFDAWRFTGLDLFRISNLPWDEVGTHHFNQNLPYEKQLYASSMARYHHHRYWTDEYVWSWWREVWGKHPVNEINYRSAVSSNLWNELAFGLRGYNFYVLDETWGKWDNCLLYMVPGNTYEPGGAAKNPVGDTPIRYCTGYIPVFKNWVNQYPGIINRLSPVNQGIGIMEPIATLIIEQNNSFPIQAKLNIESVLTSNFFSSFIIPENFIEEGRETLSDFKILFLPNALYMPEVVQKRLLEWTRNGGILVSFGPSGVFTPYGRYINGLIKHTLGIEEIRQNDEEWFLNGEVEIFRETSFGKGRFIYVPLNEMDSWYLRLEKYLEKFKLVECDSKILHVQKENIRRTVLKEMMINELLVVPCEADDPRNKYLWIVSYNIDSEVKSTVTIHGKYHRILDLSSQDCIPVTSRVSNNTTAFDISVKPGEGLLIELVADN